ncbi:hypothetical protein BCR37DRAFT_388806 [Protomyces lactucae-debilis]|uniref:RING-type domain-containing protein n=1 Tax=Protomyces lactucae-debilis TaxID=2754530 RepID=A0A1Y2F400_PROLT|nr:uncharacterized protein BCR37DRAFT_388806 [Protomyces lactucae-debilis]ORY78630.1 hypothetical protein BCR37DRAFT_388806 [Protomyces lactucae-debilis]
MSSANKLASLDSSVASFQLNNNGGASFQKQQAALHGGSKGSHPSRAHQQQHASGQSSSKPRNTHKHHRKPESSLNHLLNFSYTRPSHQDRLPVRRQARSTPSFGIGSGYHPDDKAHFVNANYRFVVHPAGDYRANLAQPDLPVPWENVLQVLASAQTQCSACPICLEAVPIAPRMSKCGHAFCLPCILRYLDSEDIKTGKTSSKWRKCPICFDGIYAKDLRPVKWFFGEEPVPSTGAEITLRLFKRSSGSPHALPRESGTIAEESVPWHNQSEALDYARLVRADATYLTQEREREVDALYKMRIEDAAAFGDDGQWIDTALDKIDDLATLFADLGIAAPMPTEGQKANVVRAPIAYEMSADAPTAYFAATAPVAVPQPAQRQPERTRHQPSPPSSRAPRSRKGQADNSQETPDAYYFYQPRTGAHAYLASLDIRLLKRAFQDFEHFPAELMARVEHVTTVKIDADLRRRTKYLSHLPLGCEVTFLECDWQARLPAGVLEPFKVELDRRRKKRNDKAISEEYARQRAQKQEDRRQRMALHSGGRASWLQDSAATEDVFDFDDDSSYFARNDTNTYDVLHQAETASSPTSGHEVPRSTTVWGTTAPAPLELSSLEQNNDGWQEQIAKFEEEATASAATEVGSPEDGKKARPIKKQKPKKLVLMSTAGARRV